jgi:hypothetical protein
MFSGFARWALFIFLAALTIATYMLRGLAIKGQDCEICRGFRCILSSASNGVFFLFALSLPGGWIVDLLRFIPKFLLHTGTRNLVRLGRMFLPLSSEPTTLNNEWNELLPHHAERACVNQRRNGVPCYDSVLAVELRSLYSLVFPKVMLHQSSVSRRPQGTYMGRRTLINLPDLQFRVEYIFLFGCGQ